MDMEDWSGDGNGDGAGILDVFRNGELSVDPQVGPPGDEEPDGDAGYPPGEMFGGTPGVGGSVEPDDEAMRDAALLRRLATIAPPRKGGNLASRSGIGPDGGVRVVPGRSPERTRRVSEVLRSLPGGADGGGNEDSPLAAGPDGGDQPLVDLDRLRRHVRKTTGADPPPEGFTSTVFDGEVIGMKVNAVGGWDITVRIPYADADAGYLLRKSVGHLVAFQVEAKATVR